MYGQVKFINYPYFNNDFKFLSNNCLCSKINLKLAMTNN